jgi:hypothetical protein
MRADGNAALENLYYHLSLLQCFIKVKRNLITLLCCSQDIPAQGGRKYRMKDLEVVSIQTIREI